MARFDIEIGKKGNGATEVARSIDEIINKLANAEKYSEVFNNSLKGQQAVLRAYEGALKNLISQGFDRLDPSVKAVKAEIDKLTASINTQKSTLADQKAIDNLNTKLKQIATNEALMSNESARAAAQTRAFQAAINALIKNGVDPADKRIKDLQNSIANIGSVQTTVGGKMKGGGFMGGLVSQAGTLIASLTSVYAVLNTLKSAFNTAVTTDALATSFSFVVDDSVERLEALRESANRLGIEFVTLAETNKKFIAAAKASNFDLEKADKIFNSVANAGAKLKLSNEQISGTFLAIEQMISKGTVSMEELRRQLGDRLPGAFSMAAKAMGVNEAQFNKMVASGEVMAKDLLPRLADELDKTYGNSQYQKIDSMQASLNRLKNTFTEFVMESNVASTVFAPFISSIETAIRSLSGLSNAADESYTRFKSTEEVFLRNKQRLEELVAEYSNAKQSAIETGESNDELRKIMNSIAEIMPGVVTSWDKYGNALDINLGKIQDMTEAQKELLRVMNREVIADISKPLNNALVQMEAAQGAIDRMTQMGVTEISKGGGIFPGDGYNTTLEEQRQRFKEAQADAVKYLKVMQDLGAELTSEQNNLLAYFGLDARGQAMRDYKKSLEGTAKTIEDAIRLINSASSKLELKELEAQFAEFAGQKTFENALKDRASQLDKFAKEAESTLKRVRDFLNDSDFSISLLGMDDRGQAEAQIRRKYESMLSSVKEGSAEYVRLNENMNIEIQASNQKFADADAKLISDMVKRRAKALQDQAVKNVKTIQDSTPKIELTYERRVNQSITQMLTKRLNDRYKKEVEIQNKINKDRLASEEEVLEGQKKLQEQYWSDLEKIKGIDDLYDKSFLSLQKHIKKAKADFEEFKKTISDQSELQLLEERFSRFISLINNETGLRFADDIGAIGREISNIVDSFVNLDKSFGNTLLAISQIAKSVNQIAQLVSQVGGGVKSAGAGSGNAWMAIIGAVVEIGGTIWNIIDSSRKKRKQESEEAVKKAKEYADALIQGELDYQELLRKRRMDEAYGDGGYSGIKSALNEAKDSMPSIQKQYDDILATIRKGRALIGREAEEVTTKAGTKWGDILWRVVDPIFGFFTRNAKSTKTVIRDVFESLESADYDKLEEMYHLGQLQGDEKTAFEQLKALKEEIEATGKSIKELQQELDELLTGTTVDNLARGFVDLYANGKRSAKDFAEYTKQVIREAMVSSFVAKYAMTYMQPFFDELARQMDSEQWDYGKLESMGVEAGRKISGGLEAMEKAFGVDLYDPTKSQKSGLQGAIERMSEQTGSELTGLYRASYEIDKESLGKLHFIDINMNALVGLNSQQLEVLEGIKEDTGDIAEHTSHLEEMKSALVEIAVNTRAGKGKSERDNGIM